MLGARPPSRLLGIDFTDLPGGDECRLLVAYTSGLRTTTAATPAFSVTRRGPSARLLRPAEGAACAPGQPVELEGYWVDEEGAAVPDEDLSWLLDGKEVARGRFAVLMRPPAGTFEVALRYGGGGGHTFRRVVRVK